MKRLIISAGVLLILLVVAGVFIPIDKYIVQSDCPGAGEPTTIRLHYILGDRIGDVIVPDIESSPYAGCPAPVRYVLFFL